MNVDASSCRDLYIPNPSCTQLHLYEWIGKLMGACFRARENLVCSLAAISPFVAVVLAVTNTGGQKVVQVQITMPMHLLKMKFNGIGENVSRVFENRDHSALHYLDRY